MSLTISFTGKKVLITGAARGLGRDLVKALHAQDATVYALARNPDNLEALKREFPNIHTICVDLGDWEATRKAVSQIGPVDCLINNAAVADIQSFLDITKKSLDDTFNINVKAVLNVAQVVVQGMIVQGKGGSIINVSSTASTLYSKNITTYCLSKAALDSMTKSMAREFGHHQIRVNSVNPTIFPSDKTKDFLTRFPDGGPAFSSRVPLRRIAQVDEVVNTVLFLMSDAAPMIHGECVVIDGGFKAS